MTSAREAVLGAVRRALAKVPAAPTAAGPSPARPDDWTAAERVERFRAKLEGVGGVVHEVADAAAAATLLGELRDLEPGRAVRRGELHRQAAVVVFRGPGRAGRGLRHASCERRRTGEFLVGLG